MTRAAQEAYASQHSFPVTLDSIDADEGKLAAGRVEDILQTYDRERRVLPPPVRMWEWGWTKSAETWNGRIASKPICVIPRDWK